MNTDHFGLNFMQALEQSEQFIQQERYPDALTQSETALSQIEKFVNSGLPAPFEIESFIFRAWIAKASAFMGLERFDDGMLATQEATKINDEDYRSYLISGGCALQAGMPLIARVALLRAKQLGGGEIAQQLIDQTPEYPQFGI